MYHPRMTRSQPRVFISYASEDEAVAKRLDAELRAAGGEVWFDRSEVRTGSEFAVRISDALEWCSVLVLVWSQSAVRSPWVKREWASAAAQDKTVIPCRLDETRLPGLLAGMVYLDLTNLESEIRNLLRTLRPAGERSDRPPVELRSEPCLFPYPELEEMLRTRGFYDANHNKEGTGIDHEYDIRLREGEKVVVDHATGLTWQHGGSTDKLNEREVQAYIEKLNLSQFAGHSDWRLPTVEEAASLLESDQLLGKLHLDPIFDPAQTEIWTSDIHEEEEYSRHPWIVFFDFATCSQLSSDGGDAWSVRAVRS